MTTKLKKLLIEKAEQKIKSNDPSHDLSHAIRVLKLAEQIALSENADLDIVIPAALFHDVIVYPKNHEDSKKEAEESAQLAKELLNETIGYPKAKIEKVYEAIIEHSFSKNLTPKHIEGKIIQDADRLDATGAISIMRTFSSGGQMKFKFYDDDDPFCNSREPDSLKYSLDLFYTRLLKVKSMMHTKLAKKVAKRRTEFLYEFLKELKLELQGK